MNINEIRIPEDSSLKNEIEEIVKLCSEAVPQFGEQACCFEEGIEENEINEWENKNGIAIPILYKEWLRFSKKCDILHDLVNLVEPKNFEINDEQMDLVNIGRVIGDGELLCFSISNGKIVRYNHGELREYDDFGSFLNRVVIRMLRRSVE